MLRSTCRKDLSKVNSITASKPEGSGCGEGTKTLPEEVVECIKAVVSQLLDQWELLPPSLTLPPSLLPAVVLEQLASKQWLLEAHPLVCVVVVGFLTYQVFCRFVDLSSSLRSGIMVRPAAY